MTYWFNLAIPVALVVFVLVLIDWFFPGFERDSVWVYLVAVAAVLTLRIVLRRMLLAFRGRRKLDSFTHPSTDD